MSARLSQSAAALQEAGGRMRKWREKGNGDRDMKLREKWEMKTKRHFLPLQFIFFSPFPLFPLIFSLFLSI